MATSSHTFIFEEPELGGVQKYSKENTTEGILGIPPEDPSEALLYYLKLTQYLSPKTAWVELGLAHFVLAKIIYRHYVIPLSYPPTSLSSSNSVFSSSPSSPVTFSPYYRSYLSSFNDILTRDSERLSRIDNCLFSLTKSYELLSYKYYKVMNGVISIFLAQLLRNRAIHVYTYHNPNQHLNNNSPWKKTNNKKRLRDIAREKSNAIDNLELAIDKIQENLHTFARNELCHVEHTIACLELAYLHVLLSEFYNHDDLDVIDQALTYSDRALDLAKSIPKIVNTLLDNNRMIQWDTSDPSTFPDHISLLLQDNSINYLHGLANFLVGKAELCKAKSQERRLLLGQAELPPIVPKNLKEARKTLPKIDYTKERLKKRTPPSTSSSASFTSRSSLIPTTRSPLVLKFNPWMRNAYKAFSIAIRPTMLPNSSPLYAQARALLALLLIQYPSLLDGEDDETEEEKKNRVLPDPIEVSKPYTPPSDLHIESAINHLKNALKCGKNCKFSQFLKVYSSSPNSSESPPSTIDLKILYPSQEMELHFHIAQGLLKKLQFNIEASRQTSQNSSWLIKTLSSEILPPVALHLQSALQRVSPANRQTSLDAFVYYFSTLKLAEINLILGSIYSSCLAQLASLHPNSSSASSTSLLNLVQSLSVSEITNEFDFNYAKKKYSFRQIHPNLISNSVSSSLAPYFSSINNSEWYLIQSLAYHLDGIHSRSLDENVDLNYLSLILLANTLAYARRHQAAMRMFSKSVLVYSIIINRYLFSSLSTLSSDEKSTVATHSVDTQIRKELSFLLNTIMKVGLAQQGGASGVDWVKNHVGPKHLQEKGRAGYASWCFENLPTKERPIKLAEMCATEDIVPFASNFVNISKAAPPPGVPLLSLKESANPTLRVYLNGQKVEEKSASIDKNLPFHQPEGMIPLSNYAVNIKNNIKEKAPDYNVSVSQPKNRIFLPQIGNGTTQVTPEADNQAEGIKTDINPAYLEDDNDPDDDEGLAPRALRMSPYQFRIRPRVPPMNIATHLHYLHNYYINNEFVYLLPSDPITLKKLSEKEDEEYNEPIINRDLNTKTVKFQLDTKEKNDELLVKYEENNQDKEKIVEKVEKKEEKPINKFDITEGRERSKTIRPPHKNEITLPPLNPKNIEENEIKNEESEENKEIIEENKEIKQDKKKSFLGWMGIKKTIFGKVKEEVKNEEKNSQEDSGSEAKEKKEIKPIKTVQKKAVKLNNPNQKIPITPTENGYTLSRLPVDELEEKVSLLKSLPDAKLIPNYSVRVIKKMNKISKMNFSHLKNKKKLSISNEINKGSYDSINFYATTTAYFLLMLMTRWHRLDLLLQSKSNNVMLGERACHIIFNNKLYSSSSLLSTNPSSAAIFKFRRSYHSNSNSLSPKHLGDLQAQGFNIIMEIYGDNIKLKDIINKKTGEIKSLIKKEVRLPLPLHSLNQFADLSMKEIQRLHYNSSSISKFLQKFEHFILTKIAKFDYFLPMISCIPTFSRLKDNFEDDINDFSLLTRRIMNERVMLEKKIKRKNELKKYKETYNKATNPIDPPSDFLWKIKSNSNPSNIFHNITEKLSKNELLQFQDEIESTLTGKASYAQSNMLDGAGLSNILNSTNINIDLSINKILESLFKKEKLDEENSPNDGANQRLKSNIVTMEPSLASTRDVLMRYLPHDECIIIPNLPEDDYEFFSMILIWRERKVEEQSSIYSVTHLVQQNHQFEKENNKKKDENDEEDNEIDNEDKSLNGFSSIVVELAKSDLQTFHLKHAIQNFLDALHSSQIVSSLSSSTAHSASSSGSGSAPNLSDALHSLSCAISFTEILLLLPAHVQSLVFCMHNPILRLIPWHLLLIETPPPAVTVNVSASPPPPPPQLYCHLIEKYLVRLGPSLSFFELNSMAGSSLRHSVGFHLLMCIDGSDDRLLRTTETLRKAMNIREEIKRKREEGDKILDVEWNQLEEEEYQKLINLSKFTAKNPNLLPPNHLEVSSNLLSQYNPLNMPINQREILLLSDTWSTDKGDTFILNDYSASSSQLETASNLYPAPHYLFTSNLHEYRSVKSQLRSKAGLNQIYSKEHQLVKIKLKESLANLKKKSPNFVKNEFKLKRKVRELLLSNPTYPIEYSGSTEDVEMDGNDFKEVQQKVIEENEWSTEDESDEEEENGKIKNDKKKLNFDPTSYQSLWKQHKKNVSALTRARVVHLVADKVLLLDEKEDFINSVPASGPNSSGPGSPRESNSSSKSSLFSAATKELLASIRLPPHDSSPEASHYYFNSFYHPNSQLNLVPEELFYASSSDPSISSTSPKPIPPHPHSSYLTSKDFSQQLYLRNCALLVTPRVTLCDDIYFTNGRTLHANLSLFDSFHLSGASTLLYPLWSAPLPALSDDKKNLPTDKFNEILLDNPPTLLSTLARSLFLLRFFSILPSFSGSRRSVCIAQRSAMVWLKDLTIDDACAFVMRGASIEAVQSIIERMSGENKGKNDEANLFSSQMTVEDARVSLLLHLESIASAVEKDNEAPGRQKPNLTKIKDNLAKKGNRLGGNKKFFTHFMYWGSFIVSGFGGSVHHPELSQFRRKKDPAKDPRMFTVDDDQIGVDIDPLNNINFDDEEAEMLFGDQLDLIEEKIEREEKKRKERERLKKKSSSWFSTQKLSWGKKIHADIAEDTTANDYGEVKGTTFKSDGVTPHISLTQMKYEIELLKLEGRLEEASKLEKSLQNIRITRIKNWLAEVNKAGKEIRRNVNDKFKFYIDKILDQPSDEDEIEGEELGNERITQTYEEKLEEIDESNEEYANKIALNGEIVLVNDQIDDENDDQKIENLEETMNKRRLKRQYNKEKIRMPDFQPLNLDYEAWKHKVNELDDGRKLDVDRKGVKEDNRKRVSNTGDNYLYSMLKEQNNKKDGNKKEEMNPLKYDEDPIEVKTAYKLSDLDKKKSMYEHAKALQK